MKQPEPSRTTERARPRWLQRMVRRRSHVTLNYGMAARSENDENPPWLGRCWGFWLPRVRWNGGKHWLGECCDVTLQWLCFWFGFTIWPFAKRKTHNVKISDGKEPPQTTR